MPNYSSRKEEKMAEGTYRAQKRSFSGPFWKKELRLRNINRISGANGIIDEFTEDINQRFAIKPLAPANYHRKLPPDIDLDEIFSIESKRAVQNDWTFSYNGKTYQILNPQSKSKLRKKTTKSHPIFYKKLTFPHLNLLPKSLGNVLSFDEELHHF